MLQPKKTKFRRQQKGRMKGNAGRGNQLAFGSFGLKTLESCFSMAGMKVETAGSYGGWDPNPDSPILHHLLRIYKELNGEDGIIQVDHAGLECSVILGKYPHLDVVSLGPTMRSPHTTSERCYIPSIAPFWALLKKALEEL